MSSHKYIQSTRNFIRRLHSSSFLCRGGVDTNVAYRRSLLLPPSPATSVYHPSRLLVSVDSNIPCQPTTATPKARITSVQYQNHRAMSSTSNAASSNGNEDAAWKKSTPEQLQQIESARAEARANPIQMDPKGNYGLICRACTKPNNLNQTFCTGCGFPCVKEDIQRLPDNTFLELVKGKDIGTKVHYRDDEIVVFDDKFPVSDNHLDVIPCEVYEDIKCLNKEHIPMLQKLYQRGKDEFLRRRIPWIEAAKEEDPAFEIDQLITAGYNFPVSVKHLHLHMVMPPFKHEKIFQYPRWHNHRKVLHDLESHGHVQLYCDKPNDEEGHAEYQRAMDNWERSKQLIKKWEEKQGKEASTSDGTEKR